MTTEKASSASHGQIECFPVPPFKRSLVSIAMLVALAGVPTTSLLANPSGGVVAGGQASISHAPRVTTVDQTSQKAIINWESFGIDPGELTRFSQPGQGAIALNRVIGNDPSAILGQLKANGNVWLINQNGILFGPNAQVDVHGILATTADIADRDFMAGNYDFSMPSQNPDASVINEGSISIGEHGLAGLVAPHVRNSGLISGRLGQVVIAGTPTFALDFYGDGLIRFEATSKVTEGLDDGDPVVTNDGTISVDGGSVLITADAAAGVVDDVINMDGILEAKAFTVAGGSIVLDGGDEGIVRVAGVLDASGTEPGTKGGTVKALGDKLAVFDGTSIDVSGHAGGGVVLVGGNYQGKGPEPNAKRTDVSSGASVHADAVTAGDGGKIIVWADETANVHGELTARGGILSGDGGLIETSSKESISVTSSPNASAPSGANGTWLIDPVDITIVQGDDGIIGTSVVGNTRINNALNGGTDVTLDTSTATGPTGAGNISQEAGAPIESSGSANLVLAADNDIILNDFILGAGLDVEMTAGGSIGLNGLSANQHSIVARSITINTPGTLSIAGTLNARNDGTATAGDITIGNGLVPSSISVLAMSTRNLQDGAGGSIDINTTGSLNVTGAFSRSGGEVVATPNVQDNDHASIASEADANAGAIDISAAGGITTAAGIFSNSGSSGNGGALNLTSNNGTISVGTLDASSPSGTAQGLCAAPGCGDITVQAGGGVFLRNDITGNSLALIAGDAITQEAGSIRTQNLGVSAVTTPALNLNGSTLGSGIVDVDVLAVDITGSGNAFSIDDADLLQIGKVGPLSGVQTNNGAISLTAGNISQEAGAPIESSGSANLVLAADNDIILNDFILGAGLDVEMTAGGSIGLNGLSANQHSIVARSITINTPGTLSIAGTLNARNDGIPTAGDITIGNGLVPSSISVLAMSTRNLQDGAGGSIDINTTGSLNVTGAFSRSGGEVVATPDVQDNDHASIASEADANAGAIDISAAGGITTAAGIFSNSGSSGNGGPLNLTSNNGTISVGTLDASSPSGTAQGLCAAPGCGDITVQAGGGVFLRNDITGNSLALIAGDAITQEAGSIRTQNLGVSAVTTPALNLNGSTLGSGIVDVDVLAVDITGSGNAFSIDDADLLQIGKVGPLSGVQTNNGAISLTAGNISQEAGAPIESSGSANLVLAADNDIILNDFILGAGLDVEMTAGGSIGLNGLSANQHSIVARSITINTPGTLSIAGTLNARNDGIPTAGDITIGNGLVPSSISVLAMSTRNLQDGAGGSIDINTTGSLNVTGAFSRSGGEVVATPDVQDNDHASIASEADANAGAIDISAAGGITTAAGIFSNSGSSGNGGPLNLTSNNGTISVGTLDASSPSGTAQGLCAAPGCGDITVQAGGDVFLRNDITGNSLALIAGDAITQEAGSIRTQNLGVSAVTTPALNLNGSTLGSGVVDLDVLAVDITGSGNAFSIDDADLLQIGEVGPLSGVQTNNGAISLTAGTKLSLAQAVNAGVERISLVADQVELDAVVSATGPDPSDASNTSIVVQANQSLVNNAGSNALQPGTGRFLVYSVRPSDDQSGGLETVSSRFKGTFADNPPNTISPFGENFFVYEFTEQLIFTALSQPAIYAENPFSILQIGTDFDVTYTDGPMPPGAFQGQPSLIARDTQGNPIDFDAGDAEVTESPYDVDIENGDLSSEFERLFIGCTDCLEITQAPLSITADDFVRPLGEANPNFTASFSGFKLDDNESVVQGLQFSTTANLTSPSGEYPIDPFGALAANYEISFLAGTLTVEDASLPGIQQIQPDATTESKFELADVQTTPTQAPSLVFVVPATPSTADARDLLFSNDGNRQLWGR